MSIYNKMSGTKRVGRPSKHNNKVDVSNLIVEFLSKRKMIIMLRFFI